MSTTTGYRDPNVAYRDVIPYPGTTTPVAPVQVVPLGEYRFVIADMNGNELAEVPAENPVWSFVLNDAGTATFTLPKQHELCTRSLMAAGQRELHIYKANTRVWGGYLWSAEGSTGQEGDNTIRFSFSDWFSRLRRRFITNTKKYTNQDQLEVAWDLINYAQNKAFGDLGITDGTQAMSGVKRDVTYPFWERANISDALIDMTALSGGFDFEITPNKVWTPSYPSKGVQRAVPFEIGYNITGMSFMEDATDMTTSMDVIGAGDESSTCIATAIDVSAAALYGLLEATESRTDVKQFSTLQARADELLRQNNQPREEPQIAAQYPSENPYTNVVGDRVKIIANDGFFNINETFRIISLTFQLNNAGREVVTVAFDSGAGL